MKRFAFLLLLVVGCSRSNGRLWFAIDPATGVCTPLSGDHSGFAGWQSCGDPCAGLDERACKSDVRCQLTLRSITVSCHAVPTPIDPCKALDAAACANDSRCALQATGAGCTCPAGSVCDCPAAPPPTCALEPCGEVTDGDACNARLDCTTTVPLVPTPVASGGARPASQPATQCFVLDGCGTTENDCYKHHECMPFYDNHDYFTGCAINDDCGVTADCQPGLRCNAVHKCVVDGCAGELETECNDDRSCEPVYALQCSPYANGPTPDSFCGPPPGSGGGSGTGGGGSGGCSGGGGGGGSCEPTFVGCHDGSGGVVAGKSVLVRDPAILDDPFWSLPRVLGLISGADANLVADGWLAQLGTTTSVGGKPSAARSGAAQFIASLYHGPDGTLDASTLGFVPTSLSNRIDLADAAGCGEARITYALINGVNDRRHRMTVIVELHQPSDAARCRAIAQTWVALSQLDGVALQSALQSIYTPLLTPANLAQVRTNEFLVGPDTGTPQAWELREFHLGADARLHQVLLPLQIDPAAVAAAPDFLTWAQANSTGLARGTVTFPAQYQVPTGSEDGSRVTLGDSTVADLVNKSTCAGCHTTATNSAFAHVAERFQGTGRAEISQFLEGELQKRAAHLGLVASGVADAVLDVKPLH